MNDSMLTQEPHRAVLSPEPRPAPAFRARAVAAGSRSLLRLSGPLDTAATPALEEALRPYRRGAPPLVIDLRAVEYIETPGLRLLLALSDELPASGSPVSLVARPGSRVERTLRLSGLDRRCPVYSTPREAWAGQAPAPTPPARDAEKSRWKREHANMGEKAKRTGRGADRAPADPADRLGFRAFARFRAFGLPAARFPDDSGGGMEEGDDHDTG
jgi:anti-anti-sigma factor